MPTIESLNAREILDSRGRPTVSVSCRLADGPLRSASVPSGASTGAAEALERRDDDPDRYRGFGCRTAVAHVEGEIADHLLGREIADQAELDRRLIELDGTDNKQRLGANAILAVSLAFARAHAAAENRPLWAHLGTLLDQEPATLPRLTVNLFSGGMHAGGQVPVQDVLLVPSVTDTIDQALACVYAIYQAAAHEAADRYHSRPLTADEGGLAPPFESAETMLEAAVASIEAAGYVPGHDVALALDVAASHFYRDQAYHLQDPPLRSESMVERLARWVEDYPIVSIEDGLAEEDWEHWPALRQALAGRALCLGDDLLCTHPDRIRRAIDAGAANALLLKVNQVGTLTEAAEACRLARDAGWHVTISARSGETEDDWLADLAVGWSGDQIKVGSITQGERLAKYNRLLAIEAETGFPVVSWPNRNA